MNISEINVQSMKIDFSRQKKLRLRFILGGLFALILIIADSHLSVFNQIRAYMETAVSPFYFISNYPRQLLDSISYTLSSLNQLELENRILRKELLLKNSELLILGQCKQENKRLYELLSSPLRRNEKKMITQVINNTNNPYRDQIIINKGNIDGVYEGQPVISDKGIVGQVVAVAKLTSRVLLICDAAHAIPTQVLRNNIRVIAFGKGCKDDLQLEYLPAKADIRIGDILVTSGLGGRFPEGYPVAVVSSIELDKNRAHTVVKAHPTVVLQHQHHLLLWSTDHNNEVNTMTPEEVHYIAKERLMQIPQVLSALDSILS